MTDPCPAHMTMDSSNSSGLRHLAMGPELGDLRALFEEPQLDNAFPGRSRSGFLRKKLEILGGSSQRSSMYCKCQEAFFSADLRNSGVPAHKWIIYNALCSWKITVISGTISCLDVMYCRKRLGKFNS